MMGQEKNMFFHNAWRNVIGGFLIMALLHSMLQTCFSLFLLPVTGDMHISTTAFSGCSSIVAIASMFAAPKIGKLMEHSKIIKKLMILCIIGMGLSYASYSLATSIIHMYISAVFLGIFCWHHSVRIRYRRLNYLSVSDRIYSYSWLEKQLCTIWFLNDNYRNTGCLFYYGSGSCGNRMYSIWISCRFS